jgi:hypothetical protein
MNQLKLLFYIMSRDIKIDTVGQTNKEDAYINYIQTCTLSRTSRSTLINICTTVTTFCSIYTSYLPSFCQFCRTLKLNTWNQLNTILSSLTFTTNWLHICWYQIELLLTPLTIFNDATFINVSKGTVMIEREYAVKNKQKTEQCN